MGEDTADEPVTTISWRDAIVWCNATSEKDGLTPAYIYSRRTLKDATNGSACDGAACNFTAQGYRLPTEAEWEYAARGGQNDTNSGPYAGSRSPGSEAWYWDNSGRDTHPVGTKQANEIGLYDMSGNVWEWCWDWYSSSYYSSSPSSDPEGAASGSYRVSHGGSWSDLAEYCRSADRRTSSPDNRSGIVGFRVVFP